MTKLRQMKAFWIGLIALVLGYNSLAMPIWKGGSVHIEGHVGSNQGMVKLQFVVLLYNVTGFSDSGSATRPVDVPVDKSGHFSLSFPVAEPGRITLLDKTTSTYIFDRQLYEPGDRLRMEANIVSDSNGTHVVTDISGAGGDKYKCGLSLGLAGDNDFRFRLALFNRHGKGIYPVADSIISAQLRILDGFRQEISPLSYEVMRADILGSVYGKMVWGLFGSIGPDFYKKTYDDTTVLAMRETLNRFKTYTQVDLPEAALAKSELYVDFVYQLARVESALDNPRVPFSLSDLCSRLMMDVHGDLMSVDLAYALLADINMSSGLDTTISTEEYTDCMRKAADTTRTPWVRRFMVNALEVRGKGAQAFDFCLPSDSTDRLVRLSDFRGKVVMIDIWGYTCTGCTLFAQAFHKAVFPTFKDSAFKVISIMTSPNTREKYMNRLRQTLDTRYGPRFSIYTFPDYVNLFGGYGVAMGEAINQHYHINGYPYILLIDKEGRIFSSTVPLFEDTKSGNVAKMTELIKEALQD